MFSYLSYLQLMQTFTISLKRFERFLITSDTNKQILIPHDIVRTPRVNV